MSLFRKKEIKITKSIKNGDMEVEWSISIPVDGIATEDDIQRVRELARVITPKDLTEMACRLNPI
jgi:hypothetical protein